MAESQLSAGITQRAVNLPNGITITSPGPVVIVGPNGSGKSRKARMITSDVPIEVVSALRNTRIAQQLQPMAMQQAKQQFESHKDTARAQPYELSNDFEFMLTALIGEAAEVSLDYLAKARIDRDAKLPDLSILEEIQLLWSKFFPGRELEFKNYLPRVKNTVSNGDEPVTYSAWEMSDGEKAALYLCGRALSAPPDSVLLIDEPETHLHSLLATQLWDAIELARPNLRLIYVTHDMTFAASRRATRYLLANPLDGLRPVTLSSDASDLAAVLLGTASLSFYAKRVIFCEGDADSLDHRLYSAWFNGLTDIVQPVGSSEMVFKSVQALGNSELIANLQVCGIVDRDFRSEGNLASLPSGISALGVHEVETLFALPDVVQAVATYMKQPFDRTGYERKIVEKYKDVDRHFVAVERWKLEIEGRLKSLLGGVSAKDAPLSDLIAQMPEVFDSRRWDFSPAELLQSEKDLVEAAFENEAPMLDEIMRLMPGKQLRSLPAETLGMKIDRYDTLILQSLAGGDGDIPELNAALRNALSPYLPV